MTLPFRRRHHDDEASHDRARAIRSAAFLESIDPADEAWLENHLAACGDCRLEHAAYLDDRRLLRSLREQAPEPPRDLWARTAAAIERESGRRSRRADAPVRFADRLVPRPARMPLGVLSGLLVVFVVVATSLAPRGGLGPQETAPGGSEVAQASGRAEPSPLVVTAARTSWLQTNADGTSRLVIANVDEVCPDEKSGCAPLQDSSSATLNLGAEPQALVGSPTKNQIVVASGSGGTHTGSVLVVPLPASSAAPTPSPLPSTSLPSTPPASAPAPSASGSSPTPEVSIAPTAAPTPEGARSIAEGVSVVGAMAYSADGRWLAFSAHPIDGSAGPDLYLWKVGDHAAVPVTSDHRTFFSGWFGGRILASRVETVIGPAGPEPGASNPASSTSAPPAPEASGAASVAPPVEGRPVSFLFDPQTRTAVDFATPDVWLPSIDPSGRFMTYWSGTLVADATGFGWSLGAGSLVLDGWAKPLRNHHASPGASATDSPQPAGSGDLAPVGPAGTPVALEAGPIAAFDAMFDPTGTRLAIWVAETGGSTVGTLQLIVLDPEAGAIDPAIAPLPGVAALRGFSMDEGRLAWVTPPGQDGNESAVQVLAWSHDQFGQIKTIPAQQLVIVR
jgi:hypothetical protein